MMDVEVEFNSEFFDNASMHWKQNKKYLGNGVYTYLCEGIFKNGRHCLRKVCKESFMDIYSPQRLCKLHYQSYKKKQIDNNNLANNQNKKHEINTIIHKQYELRKRNKKRKLDELYNYDDNDYNYDYDNSYDNYNINI